MHNPAFDPHGFMLDVAARSRDDEQMPDPEKGIGRTCYAFSATEARVQNFAEALIGDILHSFAKPDEYRIERDALGSLFVTYYGRDRSLAPLMMHSHLDSVQDGGIYDGVAGVASAIAILEDIVRRKKPLRSFRLGIYLSEESSPRNGAGCLGSAIATGTISLEQLDRIQYQKGVPLREHLLDRWWRVRDEVLHPYIRKDNTAGSLELHIEQSALVATSGAQIGIVIDGIGGACRKYVERELSKRRTASSLAKIDDITIEFRGVADHTGGTPPNPRFFWGNVAYRRDALVASGFLLNRLLVSEAVSLVYSRAATPTGYTSVPARQIVHLVTAAAETPRVIQRLEVLAALTRRQFGVEIEWNVRSSSDASISSIETVDEAMVRRYLNIPLIVSALATKALQRGSSPFGTTRATVVDYELTPQKLTFKLDLRGVRVTDLERLEEAVVRRIEATLGHGCAAEVSRKDPQPVDSKLVAVLKEAADELGISYIEMPSLPGHDSDRHAEAGIPVGMIFVRQDDGVSHSPFEKMRREDFDAAHRVASLAASKLLAS